MIHSLTTGLGLVLALAAPSTTPHTAAQPNATPPGYRVAAHHPIGGEGGWDYLAVDPGARRVYVSHGNRVDLLDADTGGKVGAIEGLDGVHGIAIAADLGRGFISNGRSSKITIFDVKTLQKIADVPSSGENPDAIVYDPSSQRVFAFNGRSSNATVLDGATGKVLGTIPMGGKPEFAVADDVGKVFVNIEDKSELAEIDPKAMTVSARWPLAPCQEPSGLAIDRRHHRLFSACDNKTMAVSDSSAHKVVATVLIGEGVDGAAFDEERGLAFSSNGEGTVTVVRELTPDAYTVAETIPTARGARTVALDPKTHTLFLPTAKFGPPPAPTAEHPRPRPSIEPGTFEVLAVRP